MPEAIQQELHAARELAQSDLAEFGEPPTVKVEDLTFAEDQVLGPWLPD